MTEKTKIPSETWIETLKNLTLDSDRREFHWVCAGLVEHLREETDSANIIELATMFSYMHFCVLQPEQREVLIPAAKHLVAKVVQLKKDDTEEERGYTSDTIH